MRVPKLLNRPLILWLAAAMVALFVVVAAGAMWILWPAPPRPPLKVLSVEIGPSTLAPSDKEVRRVIVKAEQASDRYVLFVRDDDFQLRVNNVWTNGGPLVMTGAISLLGTNNPVLFDHTVVRRAGTMRLLYHYISLKHLPLGIGNPPQIRGPPGAAARWVQQTVFQISPSLHKKLWPFDLKNGVLEVNLPEQDSPGELRAHGPVVSAK